VTTLLIFLPIAVALVLWIVPIPSRQAASLGLLAALVEVGIWIYAVQQFDFDQSGLQFSAETDWSTDLGVAYRVGMFGFSLWLVGLAVVVGAAAVAYGFWAGRERSRAYFGLSLFLTGSIVGVFTSQDLLLFYVFFETMLIPLYVLIGVWGGPGRLGATIKFVIYTVAGSLLMLIAIIALGLTQGTFDLTALGTSSNEWLFFGFVAAFAVKAPLFPLHGWLPDAYRESPPEVAAVLSGVVSKAAAYGFLRIVIPTFPGPTSDWQWLLLTLGAVTLLYGSLIAFRAPDVRGVIAYSSMAQMGLITLGLFSLNGPGFDGSVLQMVNHGLVSASLFLLAGAVERRTSTGDFAFLGGMAKGRPLLATLFMTTGIIALAVPGATTFAGEFAILLGVFKVGWGWAVVGAVAIILAAMYSLRLISAVLHRERGSAVHDEAMDLRPGELGIIVPLVACLLALSVWPAAITERSFASNSEAAVITQFKAVGPFTVISARTGKMACGPACTSADVVRIRTVASNRSYLAYVAAVPTVADLGELCPGAGNHQTSSQIGAGAWEYRCAQGERAAILPGDRLAELAGGYMPADTVRQIASYLDIETTTGSA
jgi:NADH-quinone oxidoreductase subunit M